MEYFPTGSTPDSRRRMAIARSFQAKRKKSEKKRETRISQKVMDVRGPGAYQKIRYVDLASGQVFLASNLVGVTAQDLRILRLLRSGKRQFQVAREVGYAFPSALRQQLMRLRERFQVSSVNELVKKADSLGLLRVSASCGRAEPGRGNR